MRSVDLAYPEHDIHPSLRERMVMRTFHGPNGQRLRIGVTLALHEGVLAVVLTEIPDNPGMSVTNACEHIATQLSVELRASGLVPPGGQPRWFEHYPGIPGGSASPVDAEHLDRIHFAASEPTYSGPSWERCSLDDLAFDLPSLDDVWAIATQQASRSRPR